ncbi:LysR family transcriptional regulator [Lactobacillus kalixensis]|uniref:Transcriptional regulator n=1 Tax=Lactobacillus kalixensis DSM 16043 TaxID=1423763 RepID=A0A0R1U4R6_9LACO|nr:LysR family transcriptional regulator [Lactobacillus kalixensis]KRL88241.1 transcriptional regulator [Lactobacillus kalixensis DSM 16043]
MNDPEALLHYLDVLLRESNFTKAARELYISQPYLTQLIKRIEKRLGAKILNRDTVPFSLTEAGMIYYQYLENVSYNDQQLDRKLARFTHPDKEVIRIGILESLGTFLLPSLLPEFITQNPNVEIQLFESFPRESEKRLLNEQIDCYLGQTPEALDHSLNVVTNGGETYYIVIPENSHLYQEGKFILEPDSHNLKDLLQEPLVLSAPESAIRHQVNGLFQKFHVKPNIVMESNSILTATNLSVNGLGLTLSTASILKRMKETPINLFPISKDTLQVKYFIATKYNQEIGKGLSALINIFKQTDLTATIK